MAAYFAIGQEQVFQGSLDNCVSWAQAEVASREGSVKIFRVRAGEKTAKSVLCVCSSSIEAVHHYEIKLDSLKRHLRRG